VLGECLRREGRRGEERGGTWKVYFHLILFGYFLVGRGVCGCEIIEMVCVICDWVSESESESESESRSKWQSESQSKRQSERDGYLHLKYYHYNYPY
jgi:hypothetical protein